MLKGVKAGSDTGSAGAGAEGEAEAVATPALESEVFKPDVKNLTLDENAPLFPEVPPEIEGLARTKLCIWMIFEEPETAKAALWVNVWILVLILLSAVVAVVETVPGIHRESPVVWLVIESFFVGNFSLEFVLRLWACADKHEFMTNSMNWIDFISIAPFYLEIIIGSMASDVNLKFLRILRLGRALRLVKLVRYSSGMQMIKHCISMSADALQLFGFIFAVLLIVCASAIYYTERGTYHEDDELYWRTNPVSELAEISPFQSVPGSCWWCIVTLTTVGYGDYYPITYFGQLMGFITQMLGVLCLALPLSIIGSNFHEIRQALKDGDKEGGEEDKPQPWPGRHPLDAVDNINETAEKADKLCEEVVNISKALISIIDLLGTCKPINADDVYPVLATDNPLMAPDQQQDDDAKDEVPHELGTLESDLLGVGVTPTAVEVSTEDTTDQGSTIVGVETKHVELIENVLNKVKDNINQIHLQLE